MTLNTRWFAASLIFVFGSAAHAQVTYTLSNVVDTSGSFSNFGHFLSADDGTPALNNLGVIGTWAQTDAGPQGFYRFTSGGAATTIVDNSGTYTGFSTSANFSVRRASINNSGQVAFHAFNGTRFGIYSGSGTGPSSVTTIADTTTLVPGQSSPFAGLGNSPSINGSGLVAFTGGGGSVQGTFTGNGGALTTVAQSGGSTTSGTIFGVGEYASINASGTVAFRGTTPEGVDFHRIWLSGAAPLPTVFTPVGTSFANGFGGGNPTLNASGNVAFHAFLDSGQTGIFRGNGGTPTTIVDSTGPFASFGMDPSINASDFVVFVGTLDAGGYGIYNGPNPSTNKIVGLGDPLFGSTVTALNIGPYALNDLGQVAFFYTLADGRNGIAIANPVPEPSSIILVGLTGCGWLVRRHVKRKSK